MQISFVRSGGFAGPATRVQGTINLNGGQAEVTGDAAYRRTLSADETEAVREGADPSALTQAANLIAASQAKSGVGDVDNYTISLKTSDSKTYNVSLNAPVNPSDLQGISPAVAKFLSWLQKEAQNIFTRKMSGN